jgi:hypothetical protein
MVDLKKYHDRLQNKIREAMSADKILEGPWWEVVIKDLNLMSYYCARDIALETKGSCDKNYLDGTLAYKLPYEEWPPMRLMALTLIVSYWLGWISTSHGLKQPMPWSPRSRLPVHFQQNTFSFVDIRIAPNILYFTL